MSSAVWLTVADPGELLAYYASHADMDPRSLESTLRALGHATNQSLVQSVINDERFHRLLTSITTKLESLDARSIARMANALGLFPSRTSPEMLECAQTICEVAVKRTNAFSPSSLASLALGLAVRGVQTPKLVEFVRMETMKSLQDFDPGQMCNILEAYRRWNVFNRELVDNVVERMTDEVDRFTGRDVVLALNVMSKLALARGFLLRRLTGLAFDNLPQFTGSQLVQLMSSLAKLRFLTTAAADDIVDAIGKCKHTLPTTQVSEVLFALALSDYEGSETTMQKFVTQYMKALDGSYVTLSSLADVAWSLCFSLTDDTSALAEVVRRIYEMPAPKSRAILLKMHEVQNSLNLEYPGIAKKHPVPTAWLTSMEENDKMDQDKTDSSRLHAEVLTLLDNVKGTHGIRSRLSVERNVPIGPYHVDFFDAATGLVIDIDTPSRPTSRKMRHRHIELLPNTTYKTLTINYWDWRRHSRKEEEQMSYLKAVVKQALEGPSPEQEGSTVVEGVPTEKGKVKSDGNELRGRGYVSTVAAMSWPTAICKLTILFFFYFLGLLICFMPKCALRRWARRVQRYLVVWLYDIRPPAYSSVRFSNVRAPIKGTSFELDGILVLPGEFFPLENEREDAAAAIDWLVHDCEYYDGEGIGVHGLSYNGMCAYSSLSNPLGRQHVKCIVPGISACELYPVIFGHDGNQWSFELVCRWLWLVIGKGDTKPLPGKPMPLRKRVERVGVLLQFFFMREAPPFKRAYWSLPLENVDRLLLNGQPLEVYQKAIRDTDVDGEFWKHRNVLCDLRTDTPLGGIHFVGGWYDFFLRQMLKDYTKRRPLAELRGRKATDGDQAYPVTLEIIQSREDSISYLHLSDWPPRDTDPMNLVMTSNGRLVDEKAAMDQEEGVVRYHYDPRAPTPAVGGTSFNAKNCGEKLQDDFERERLANGDLVVFTSPPFKTNALIVGNVKCRATVKSSAQSVDIVCRLCRVDRKGHSYNLCDGLERLWDAGSAHTVEVDLGPTCVLIRKGERVRLQMTSAAYPRWLRNFNTGNRDIARETELGPVAEQQVIVGSPSVSLLRLPTLRNVSGDHAHID
ncbi:hypothetical protein FOZ60_006928 [Perkinsus olseni]|uniref:Xaa-Pro dipeptidyl-peptidase C-terminal domain-containing protein n=1 Tax=Perkinsus olseni TaxID=32597 RepID=A0A7J6PEY2_PEROL|nr:hypothetical protein FOZ60_006928 [Perkinsus olseni]